jgi:hypothetical protein
MGYVRYVVQKQRMAITLHQKQPPARAMVAALGLMWGLGLRLGLATLVFMRHVSSWFWWLFESSFIGVLAF